MRLAFQTFFDILQSSAKAPYELQDLLRFLAQIEITDAEKALMRPALKRLYKVDDPWAVAEQPPNVEEFLPLMDRLEIKGWLRDVVMMCEEMESPASFNFASALAVLGASLRRRVYVDRGFFKVWPAVQVGLIGHSSIAKTTGADWIVTEMAVPTGTFNELPDEGSAEGLKSELAYLTKTTGEATGLIYVGELATYMDRSEYMKPLVQTLNDLFDSRAAKRRKVVSRLNEGPMTAIAVSAIFATNESNLAKAVPAAALDSGLFGRMLLFYRFHEPKECPDPPHPDPTDLQARLVLMSQLKGAAYLTADASKLYNEKLYKRYKRLKPEDERLVAFCGRVRNHCLRLAMLFAISENPSDGPAPPMIEEKHLLAADGLLMWLMETLPAIYSHIGNTQWGADRKFILGRIARAGGRIQDAKLREQIDGIRGTVLTEHLRDLQMAGLVNYDAGVGIWSLKRK